MTLGQEGIISGWAFQDNDGSQAKMSPFEEGIFSKLLDIQAECPYLIPPQLDIMEEIGLDRMLRWSAVAQAENQGVAGLEIDWINRWRLQIGGDEAKAVSGNMWAQYLDERIMMKKYLRFSTPL
jgi:hypothetical protein